MPIYAFGGAQPFIDPTAFIHPDAILIGHVTVGPRCYIGPGASLRGDWVSIRIGAGCNVQDFCVIHGYPGVEVVLDEDCHLGHGCIIHGARLERNILVGMNAVIQDDAVLGAECMIGAGCVVPGGFVVPPRKVAVGVPAKIVGDVSDERIKKKFGGTLWYQELAERSLWDLKAVPLAECRGAVPDLEARPPLADRLAWVKELTGYTGPPEG